MLIGLLACWLISLSLRLYQSAQAPVEALLVLGGSIRREIHAAEIMGQFPEAQVLVSSGSRDPCIRLLFEQFRVPLERVWLENCARSTFGNFYFSLPVLQHWQVHKVRLITSSTHLPRAQWLGQIILGAHGIWVEPEIVAETGIPGNHEQSLKTVLDVTRGLAWAIASQVYTPQCGAVLSLSTVDLTLWRQRGFKCEHQAGIEGS
ncbi:MAG: YdcF family protein [Leptolyngbyaceae cyanobacterium SM1_1_3]|nr:YdcF family protein [Leptolyngbyaceae cyanobacterium SM1_1_3]NJN03185.1 YdcF family protein [Leptolyngbyaceae cyanobacterium RM1_1_2]NJO08894.1 YdcF family protein [Leptolyngbyaceae cyanobacterium SL_1_1]